MPIPKAEAPTLPIIYDAGNLPIIFNNQKCLVEQYNSTTLQHLFKTLACIPMTATGHALAIPANAGANPTLSTMLLMILTLLPLILL
jgi:hypothetical protein